MKRFVLFLFFCLGPTLQALPQEDIKKLKTDYGQVIQNAVLVSDKKLFEVPKSRGDRFLQKMMVYLAGILAQSCQEQYRVERDKYLSATDQKTMDLRRIRYQRFELARNLLAGITLSLVNVQF